MREALMVMGLAGVLLLSGCSGILDAGTGLLGGTAATDEATPAVPDAEAGSSTDSSLVHPESVAPRVGVTAPYATPTGFSYPTSRTPDGFVSYGYANGQAGSYYREPRSAGWLARSNDYDDGLYHIGQDIGGEPGDSVYSVCAGEICYISFGGWTKGGTCATAAAGKLCAVFVQCRTIEGTSFYALYGHITVASLQAFAASKGGSYKIPTSSGYVTPRVPVGAGEEFAKLGAMACTPSGTHLHFGITTTRITGRFGNMLLASGWPKWKTDTTAMPKTNGYVDPIGWIQTRSPYRATSYASGGMIVTSSGSALPGARVTFTRVSGAGTTPPAVTADEYGSWKQSGFASGTTYRATPAMSGYTFSPASQDFSAASAGVNFVGSVLGDTNYAAGGLVVTSSGSALPGARVTFTRVSGAGTTPPAVTADEYGSWKQSGFASGTTYRATPAMSGYTFSPASQDFSAASAGVNFVGSAPTVRELLSNGSYTVGRQGWSFSGDFWAGTTLANYKTPPGYAAACVDGSTGAWKNSAYGTMHQTVAIPAGASTVAVSFWYNVISEETTTVPYDVVSVWFQDAGGANLLVFLTSLSNADRASGTSYQCRKITLTPADVAKIRGQSVRLLFLATSNAAGRTVFRIDDVSVQCNG